MQVYQPGHYELVGAINEHCPSYILRKSSIRTPRSNAEDFIFSNLDEAWIVEGVFIIKCQDGGIVNYDSGHGDNTTHIPLGKWLTECRNYWPGIIIICGDLAS